MPSYRSPSPRAEPAPGPTSHRWLLLLCIPAAVIAAALGLRSLLHPERISAFLISQAQKATGLELSLARAADVGLWPDLHVQLAGLSARVPGAERPILRVERVEASLPWSMLRSSDIRLSGLRLIEPQLDLVALEDYLDRSAEVGPPAPLRLPALDAPLEVRQGRIDGDDWALRDLDISLPALHEGTRSHLSVRAQWAPAGSGTPQRFAFRLGAVPRSEGASLHLGQIELDLALDAMPEWRPRVEGEMGWSRSGTLRLDLATSLPNWPPGWPELPLPPDELVPIDMTLRYAGDTDFTGQLDFTALRGEDGLRASLSLNDTLAWLQGRRADLLPPAQGTLEMPRLEYGGVQASGVRLRLQSDADARGAEDSAQ